jgi:hypothetical protein
VALYAIHGFFVFFPQLSKLASSENKKSLALRAQGLVEVSGGQ